MMFRDIIDTDFVGDVKLKAIKTEIKNDREKYNNIFNRVKLNLIDNSKTIISDVGSILNKSNSNNNYIDDLVLYTRNTKQTAVSTANILHAFDDYTQVREIIPDEEYDVLYNGRPLIHIYKLNIPKRIKSQYTDLKNLFYPIIKNKLLYFPPEIELIDVYKKLYLPNYSDDYIDLLYEEMHLYDAFNNRVKKILDVKLNDKKVKTIINIDKKNSCCKNKRSNDINDIKSLIFDYLNNENYIIIGDWAYNYIKKKKDIQINNIRLQVISEKSIDIDYQNISIFLSKHTKFGVFYKKRMINMPKDNRIERYTLYIKYPTLTSYIEKPFLDIYNCAAYELTSYKNIVYNKFNLKIGSYAVLLRFLFIDLWLIRYIYQQGVLSNDIFKKKGNEIIDNIRYIKKNIDIRFDANYIGVNKDYKIFKRIKLTNEKIKKKSYIPESYQMKKNIYKIISSSLD